ncbi:MAG: PAS domain-containing protein, partial [Desulfovibrio sp.]|nr:PAS domain-containing protein [Desulfovibrio sp.]
ADAWVLNLVEQTRRLVGSDLFQLFASEVAKLPGGIPMLFAPQEGGAPGTGTAHGQAAQLSSQLPLMRTLLSEFINYTSFSEARIVNTDGDPYISTQAAMTALSSSQKQFVARAVESGEMLYGPLEVRQEGIVFDLFVPIMPPQYEKQNNRPSAVIVVTQPADQKLTELLAPGPGDSGHRSIRLVQNNGGLFQAVTPGMTTARSLAIFPLDSSGGLEFGLRPSFSGEGEVYSSGARLRVMDWWIVVESAAVAIQEALSEQARTIYGLAGLVAAVLVLLVSAVWWRLIGQQQSAINAQFRDLLVVIDEQKKLLDGINSTMSDPISLSDNKGVYRYVNAAFARAVGRPAEDVIGLDGPAVFGFDTARRLNIADQHVLMTGESITVNEVLWLQAKRFHFQISKTPLKDAVTRAPQGIVSVFRDITQLVETEERSRRVVQQTIDALVRTIEESDPFLGGHSRVMGSIAGLIARQLRLGEADVATIEAAANLSQVGKMFVPREILLKPGTLTPEEKREMERHVEHAYNILKSIEFDLPVLQAIYQMNERLDGKGYPKGLAGDQVTIHARVLAVANSFAAMAKPRSYRAALAVHEILTILEGQKDSYDQEVVAALRQVLSTPAGERVVQQAASSKAV